jgi:hypothetical protein
MRRYYRATPKGRAALRAVKPQIGELFYELIADSAGHKRHGQAGKCRHRTGINNSITRPFDLRRQARPVSGLRYPLTISRTESRYGFSLTSVMSGWRNVYFQDLTGLWGERQACHLARTPTSAYN